MKLSLRFGTDRKQVTLVSLKLIRVGCTVECVSTIRFLRKAELPVNAQLFIAVVALVENLSLPPVAVGGTSVASPSTTADAVVDTFYAEAESCIRFYAAETTSTTLPSSCLVTMLMAPPKLCSP